MRLKLQFLLFSLAVFGACFANQDNKFLNHVKTLSSSKFEGRAIAGKGEQLSIQYILQSLRPKKTKVFLDTFIISKPIIKANWDISATNIRCFIDNKRDSTILLIAHYDHLGKDTLGLSLFKGNPTIHPGADDNASGVGFLIELQRVLATKMCHYNILFLFTSGEEYGLYGAKFFAANDLKKYKVTYFLNFDLVGRYNETTKYKFFCADHFPERLKQRITNTDKDGICNFSSYCPDISDHIPFVREGINGMFITSGIHQDYHKPSDSYEKLDYAKMSQLFKLILSLIENSAQ